MRLFHGSITYLTLLFVAVAIDPLLPLPTCRRPVRPVTAPGRARQSGCAARTAPEHRTTSRHAPSMWSATSTQGTPVKYCT